MPRRRALTEAQLENLLALPTAEADLVRHWTLGDDRSRRHRPAPARPQPARLRAAALCAALSRPAAAARRADPGSRRCVSSPTSSALRRTRSRPTPPGPRPATSSSTICATAFGFADLHAGASPRIAGVAAASGARHHERARRSPRRCMDELRRRRIIVPGPSVVERLVAAILVAAERHVAGQLTRGLIRRRRPQRSTRCSRRSRARP